MTRVGVRSEALRLVADRLATGAAAVHDEATAVAVQVGCPGLTVALRARLVRFVGPAGLWGEGLGLEVLAARLRGVARAYAEVEEAVAATLRAVAAGADGLGGVGWLDDGPGAPVVTEVTARRVPARLDGPADLVALGEDLDGGRVRVLELAGADGGTSWVVVVPGTQEWSPRAGANPFDLTGDVRAVTGDITLAAVGVEAALRRARARTGRPAGSARQEPVLLVGHSQGGIHAAALAADPGFGRRHRVTHLLTTGAPVGLFPVPPRVRGLSVEHADDPVPTLDLTPNPVSGTWRTLRVGPGPPADVGRHRLAGYEATLRAAQDAPWGTVPDVDAWEVGARGFLHRPVVAVTEVAVTRPVHDAHAPGAG